jgi:hypothetical protein
MLNARLYRAALLPFLLALAICAFSLGGRPAPLTSTLTPDAFEGPRAFADMTALAAAFGERQAGSAGDERLARHIAAMIEGLGGAAGGGFSVRLERFGGRTAAGQRSLLNVVAQRPGSTNASPIVILAHRDAAEAHATAEMSGTAALLELARVFSARATKRTIVLVSTSGGSGGAAGAAQLLDAGGAIAQHGPVDGAIVLGDLAAARPRYPLVIPYSDGYGLAPLQLQRTVAEAIAGSGATNPGAPSTFGQLAHLAFPLAVGEQAPLIDAGVPAVLIQASGDEGPPTSPSREPVSAERLESLGRAVLSTVDALDTSPDLLQGRQTALVLGDKTLPGWAVALLTLTLLLAAAATAVDALARARRRGFAVGRSLLWVLSFGLPFLACALLAYALGGLGIVDATSVLAPAAAIPFDAAAATAVAAVLLTFALAWLLWGRLIRRLGAAPDPDVGGLAVVLVLAPIGLLAWLADPYTALLIVPAVHLLMPLSSSELRPGRLGSLALVALALLPLAALCAFYADQLGVGAPAAAWAALLVVAGGHVGVLAALLWSAALGAIVAALRIAAIGWQRPAGAQPPQLPEITIRGPLNYAGPGSLGGTESALRR